jgi:serine/threonine protein kinase
MVRERRRHCLPVFTHPLFCTSTATCKSKWFNYEPIYRILTHPSHQLTEIAEGLIYLHDEGLVHGDLRGRNVLVDDDGRARLTDFGLSGFIDATMPNSSFGGSVAWMSPEQLFPSRYGIDFPYPKHSAADMYSFGSVCVEVSLRMLPTSAFRLMVIHSSTRVPLRSPVGTTPHSSC